MNKTLIKNFIKADLRQKNLLFWDWLFPIFLFLGFTIFIKETSYSSFIFPSLITFLIFQGILFSVPFRLAQYKENGIIKLIANEDGLTKFIISFVVSRVIIILLQLIIFIPIGIMLLKPTIKLSVVHVLIGIGMCMIITYFLAIIIGIFSNKENVALGLSQLVYFIFLAISGIFYPISDSPLILQKISKLSPIKYVNEMINYGFTSKADDLSKISIGSLISFIILSVLLIVSVKVVDKKTKNR